MYNIGKGTPLASLARLVGIGFAVVALFYWLIQGMSEFVGRKTPETPEVAETITPAAGVPVAK